MCEVVNLKVLPAFSRASFSGEGSLMKAVLDDPVITATLNHVEGAKAELDGTH